MLAYSRVAGAILAAGLLLFSTGAEARFGKRSSSRPGSGSSGSGSSGGTHRASPIGSPSSGGGGGGNNSRPVLRPRPGAVWVAPWAGLWPGWSRPYRFFPSAPRTQEVTQEVEEPSSLIIRLALNSQSFSSGGEGGAMDLVAGLEGRRWGFDVRGSTLSLLAEDGSGGTDTLRLLSTHLSFALWSTHKARVRVEGGVAAARAPEVTFIGPSLAGSAEACLFGPVDGELRLQVVPFPHRQVDAQAGLAVHLGPFVLRTGYRWLLLDDAGWLGDGGNQDTLRGPYAGLGLTF
jgi:hypothetical protein